jgi:hypothetical protein
MPAKRLKTAFLSLVAVKEIAGIDFESAGELQDIVEANILFTPFHFADEITVHLYQLAKLLLGQAALRADGTQAFAER